MTLPLPTFGLTPAWATRLVGDLELQFQNVFRNIENMLNAKSNFADLYTTGGSTAQTGIGTSYTKITGFATGGQAEFINAITGDNRLVVKTAGVYMMQFYASFTGTATTEYSISVHVGQAEADNKAVGVVYVPDTNTYQISCSGLISVAALAEIEMFIKADGASKSFTPKEMHLWIKLIG